MMWFLYHGSIFEAMERQIKSIGDKDIEFDKETTEDKIKMYFDSLSSKRKR